MSAARPHSHQAYQPSALLYPLHLALAALFAFVLPFICWATLATPGHPHGLPHFVFLAPQSAAASHATADESGHGPLHETPVAISGVAAPSRDGVSDENGDENSDKPASQSIVPLLAVVLLAPIVLAIATVLGAALLHFVRCGHSRLYRSLDLPTITPPPRLVATV